PQFLPSDHDPPGTRLHRRWQRFHRELQREWKGSGRRGHAVNRYTPADRLFDRPNETGLSRVDRLGWLLLLGFLLACPPACSRRGDPQSVFDHSMLAFRNGHLADAQQEAEAGYRQFHKDSTEWRWKFLLLQAEALASRGMSDKALSLI